MAIFRFSSVWSLMPVENVDEISADPPSIIKKCDLHEVV